jgi:SAM-dependent methyltransferase
MGSLFQRLRPKVVAKSTAPRIFPPAVPRARNTDADWQLIGEQDPYYGVLTDPRFRRESMTDADKLDFFASGRADIHSLLHRIRTLFGPFEPKSALDFGCGVGRLTRPLAELTGDAVGFDVSSGMLAEARQYSATGAAFVDIFPQRQFDWVISLMVLQHITPTHGYEAVGKLLEAVAPGGGITLQVTFARTSASGGAAGRLIVDGNEVRAVAGGEDTSWVPDGIMIMHDYDLGRIITQFYLAGFSSVHLDKTDHGGVIGATLFARRDRAL